MRGIEKKRAGLMNGIRRLTVSLANMLNDKSASRIMLGDRK